MGTPLHSLENSMKLTPFGLFVRKIRLEKGLTLKQMADHLKVSSAYLSAVELGEKPLTPKVVNQTEEFLMPHFDHEEMIGELHMTAADSMNIVVPASMKRSEKALVAAFARRVRLGDGSIPIDVESWIYRDKKWQQD